MNDSDWELRLRRHVAQVVEDAPRPRSFPADRAPTEVPRHGAHGGRRWFAVAAAAVVLLVAASSTWALQDRGDDQVASTPEAPDLAVRHEVVELTMSWDLTCTLVAEPPLDAPPSTGSLHATVESWAAPEQELWFQRVEYGDGSVRSMARRGPLDSPDEEYVSGRAPLGAVCPELGIGVVEPTAGQVLLRTAPGAQVSIRSDTFDVGRASGAQRVPGEHTDASGRAAELWIQNVTGTITSGDGSSVGVTETYSWFVERGTDRELERRVELSYDGVGSVVRSLRWVDSGETLVPSGTFATDGMERTPTDRLPRIDTNDAGPTTTVVATEGGPATTGPCVLAALPDLSAAMPDGFSGPFPGAGGGAAAPVCARHWIGDDPGVHVTQSAGWSPFPNSIGSDPSGAATTTSLVDLHAGESSDGPYSSGLIEDGHGLQHTGEPPWFVLAYGLTDAEFGELVAGAPR